jgi:hypothetical protein
MCESSASSTLARSFTRDRGSAQRAVVEHSLRAALQDSAPAYLATLVARDKSYDDMAQMLYMRVRESLPPSAASLKIKELERCLSAEQIRTLCHASRLTGLLDDDSLVNDAHRLAARLRKLPLVPLEHGEAPLLATVLDSALWAPHLMVNDENLRCAPLGSSYGHLSVGVFFVLNVFSCALEYTLTAALKHARLGRRIPDKLCGKSSEGKVRVGLLLQNKGFAATRGGRAFPALTPRCRVEGCACASALDAAREGLQAAEVACGHEQDSHVLACVHLPTLTFCVDAAFVLSTLARAELGYEPPLCGDAMEAGGEAGGEESSQSRGASGIGASASAASAASAASGIPKLYDEAELSPSMATTLLLPLVLHEFSHAMCGSTAHDEDFASVLTSLTTAAMSEALPARIEAYARGLKNDILAARSEAVAALRGNVLKSSALAHKAQRAQLSALAQPHVAPKPDGRASRKRARGE